MTEEKSTLRKPAQITLIVGTAVFGLSLSVWVLALGWLAISFPYEDVRFGYASCLSYPVITIIGLLTSFILYMRKHYRTSILAMIIPFVGVIIAILGFISVLP